MAIYFRDAEVLSVLFISGDPFISGFPGPIQMVANVCSEIDDDDDGNDDEDDDFGDFIAC